MSSMFFFASEKLRDFLIWLCWSPIRFFGVIGLVLLIGLVFGGAVERSPRSERTAGVHEVLPEGWQSWPKATAAPRR